MKKEEKNETKRNDSKRGKVNSEIQMKNKRATI